MAKAKKNQTKGTKLFSKCSKHNLSVPTAHILILEPSVSHQEIVEELAPVIKEHYATETILRKWGREKIAGFVALKIPTSKRGKSGDLGEILATEYINCGPLAYRVPINRLRWKDSREMAMRGEDVIGFDFDRAVLGFLKVEAKSGKQVGNNVLAAARGTLEKNAGLPLPHTLSFIMERLFEANQDEMAERIEEFVASKLPDKSQVAHLIFVFSENDPSNLLTEEAQKHSDTTGIEQYSVGFRVNQHQELIEAVFKGATGGRDNRTSPR